MTSKNDDTKKKDETEARLAMAKSMGSAIRSQYETIAEQAIGLGSFITDALDVLVGDKPLQTLRGNPLLPVELRFSSEGVSIHSTDDDADAQALESAEESRELTASQANSSGSVGGGSIDEDFEALRRATRQPGPASRGDIGRLYAHGWVVIPSDDTWRLTPEGVGMALALREEDAYEGPLRTWSGDEPDGDDEPKADDAAPKDATAARHDPAVCDVCLETPPVVQACRTCGGRVMLLACMPFTCRCGAKGHDVTLRDPFIRNHNVTDKEKRDDG